MIRFCSDIPRFDVCSVLGSVIEHPAQLMVQYEDTLELLLGFWHFGKGPGVHIRVAVATNIEW